MVRLYFYFFSMLCAISAGAISSSEANSQIVEDVGEYGQRVESIAGTSACAQYRWKNRGKAPLAYTKGIALSFARSYCRTQTSGSFASPALIMSRAASSSASKDALTHYSSAFRSLGLDTKTQGSGPMLALYTLGVGLGMRESSGKYCEGWDVSAGSNRPSNEAEAGLFQASFNSVNASSELRRIYEEYRSNPGRCLLAAFKTGVKCKSQPILGSGAGADYQKFARSCPAFATEYSMILLRILRAHFGPVNRREAEVISSCHSMLSEVRRFVDEDVKNACTELL